MDHDIFVGKYYLMDPDTDKVLHNGSELREGMRVLIDRVENREDIVDTMSPGKVDSALWNNRWCKVTRVEVRNDQVSFVGEYDDGTTKKRVVSLSHPWLVKIDSIPDPFKEIRQVVTNLVYYALQYQDSLSNMNDSTIQDMQERAGKVSNQILQTLAERV